MTSSKTMFVVGALSVALTAPAFAQGTGAQPPATPPAGAQQPPATPPAGTQPPAAQKPAAPMPFPEGAKIAYVDVQFIASNSAQGKTAAQQLETLNKKKLDELNEKNKALEAARAKLNQGGNVMNASAIAQLQKDIERQERELQFAQQDAQSEVGELRNKLLEDFQTSLNPILEEIRKERGLHMIFSVGDSGLAAADRGLDLSQDVIKKLDAAKTAPPKK